MSHVITRVTRGNYAFHFGHGHLAAVLIHFRYLPRRQPQEHTAFGCTIPRFSQFPDWHSEWCSEQVNPPPYGRTALEALREGFRHPQQFGNCSFLFDDHAGLRGP